MKQRREAPAPAASPHIVPYIAAAHYRAGFIKLYLRKVLALSADAAMRPAWYRHAGAPRMPVAARFFRAFPHFFR
jgi:hypothetical protein